MPLEDLDLEFEDEDEQNKKKSDAIHDAADIEFGAAVTSEKASPKSSPSEQVTQAVAIESSGPKPHPSAATSGAQVKKLEEVRAKIAQARTAASGAAPAAKATATQAVASKPEAQAQPVVQQGSAALHLVSEPDGQNLAQLTQLIEDTKFEARVQVAVAQEMSSFMAEMLSDAKLMQHQIQQLLMRLNQKNAANKPELVAIQKALADFLSKKRKFPNEK
jgi:hypothetical protein